MRREASAGQLDAHDVGRTRLSGLLEKSVHQRGDPDPPVEITNQQLNTAIAGTASNPSSIGPFTGTFSDPPTEAEMQAYAAWGESLRQAVIR